MMFNIANAPITGRIGVTTLQLTTYERDKMRLNKELQLKILNACADNRPKTTRFLDRMEDFGGFDAFIAELQYLMDHNLVDASRIVHGAQGHIQFMDGVRITTKGMDYLSEEESIGKELNVVTIKIHEDTIKQLVAQKILASNLSQPHKQKLLDRLKALPAVAIERLVVQLVDKGLENTPDVLPLLESLLS